MSADNWTTCPRCRDTSWDEYKANYDAVMAKYGRVSVEEFDQLRTDLSSYVEPGPTFREDYEFYGANTGVLTVSYSGRCEECGLKFNFKEERKFYPCPS